MRPHCSGIFLSLLLVSLSCTYTLDDVDYKVDIKPVVPEGSISLENYEDEDTIYLSTATYFIYEIDYSNQAPTPTTEVYYDNRLLNQFSGTRGQFDISAQRLTTGTHQLKIAFKLPSGSGSLADKFNMETAQIWRSWTVIVDIELPPVPVITTSIENGFLKISWPKYEKSNFEYYRIFYGQESIEFHDTSHNFYIDSLYVGGSRIYMSVVIQNKVGSNSYASSVYDALGFNAVYHPEDSTIAMTWSKVKYPGAFKSFVISEGGIVTKTITSATDTTLRYKPTVAFPRNAGVSFQLFDRNGTEKYANGFSVDNPSGAKRTVPGATWYYNAILGKVICNNGFLNIFDSSMEIIETFYAADFSMPWPGNYIYYRVTDGVSQRNMLTGVVKKRVTFGINIPTITPRAISAADNQLINYELLDLLVPFDRHYISGRIDMSTGTIISSSASDYDPKTTTFYLDLLSDDGRYLYRPNPQAYYSVSGSTNTLLGSAPVLGHFYGFRPDNNDEVILRGFSNGPVKIMRTTDQAELRTVGPPEPGYTFQNYDPATKYLLYTSDNDPKIYLVHIETGAAKVVTAYGAGCTLMNGFLISQDGYYIKVL